MYRTGDYVVHAGQGVCRLVSCAEEGFKLEPVGQRNPMVITLPRTLEDKIRPLISREDALALIDQYPALAGEPINERGGRQEVARVISLRRRGDCRESLRIVKGALACERRAKAAGKKPSSMCQEILKDASHASLSELSCVLGVPEDELVERLREREARSVR